MNKQPRDWATVRRRKTPCQVSLRLTEEEFARLETLTNQLGVSKAGYIKSLILGQPIPQASRRPKAVEADLRQVLGLLGKLGSNANQIARWCNSGSVHDYRAAIESLREIRGELMAMRGLLLGALSGELGLESGDEL